MNTSSVALRSALASALARMAAVPEPAAVPDCELLQLPHAVAPAWPWTGEEALCAAAQLGCYEAACEMLLPALAQWGRAADRTPLAIFASQTVRNTLGQLRELPLVSAGRDRADAVVWRLLTAHQLKFAVAADARLGPLALVAYLAAMHVVADALGLPVAAALPSAREPSQLAARALTETWQLAAAARLAAESGELA